MARFIAVPKPASGGRLTLWEVIDTAPKGTEQERADRCRIGAYASEHFARALATVLDGAGAVLDAELHALDSAEPF